MAAFFGNGKLIPIAVSRSNQKDGRDLLSFTGPNRKSVQT
jgi:hypothetical protein